MGLYRRAGSRFWWLKLRRPDGSVLYASTEQEDRAKAEEVLRAVRSQQHALARAGATRMPTVDEFRKGWLDGRRAKGIISARDDAGRFIHLPDELLRTPMDKVQREDIRLAIKALMDAGELAPRTIRRVHEVLRVMFRDAVADGLIPPPGCRWRSGERSSRRSRTRTRSGGRRRASPARSWSCCSPAAPSPSTGASSMG